MTRNIKKFRISALCITLLFVLTTAIGLLALPLKDTYALLGSETPGTLKFKQVAAGKDFAIALTYDNDLYAWSLSEKSDDNKYKINASGSTLGEYYPSVPTRLDIKLSGVTYGSKQGESKTSVQKVGVSYEDRGSFEYIGHSAESPDSIKQIVATRTTAAFLTAKGLIYIWGDEAAEPNVGSANTGLLLRSDYAETDNSTDYYDNATRHRYEPSLINYKVGDCHWLLPVGHSKGDFADSVLSLSASEYNYLVNITRTPQTDTVNASFIWGQSVYGQQTVDGLYDFDKTGSASVNHDRRFVADGDATQQRDITAPVYLGDGTVYYYNNDNTSADNQKLYVRGKNFAVTEKDSSAIATGSLGLSEGENKYFDGGTYKTDDSKIEIADAVTRGFQELGSVNLTASAKAEFFNAKGANPAPKIETDLPTFSAGAGYGFLLSGSSVYFWGDNRLYGKIASDKTLKPVASLNTISGASVSYKQVVAGKVVTGYPVLEQINTESNKATNNTEKWNGENIFADAYIDGNTVISAALTVDGSVKLFGSINGVPFSDSLDTVMRESYGVLTGNNATNKIAALFPGYGNSLFALSSLGKIYIITGEAEGANVTFACKLYDEFTNKKAVDEKSVIDNWTLGAADEIEFLTGYYAPQRDTDGNFEEQDGKIVWDYDNSAVTVSMKANNTVAVADSHAKVNSAHNVIASDYSGDSYRMILPIVQKKKDGKGHITINGTNNEIDGSIKARAGDTPENFGMKFYWIWQEGTGANAQTKQSEPIPDDVAFRYFDITYNYIAPTEGENPAPADINFTVKPLRSTAGKSILIKYWVGRYDSEVDFSKVNSESDADNMAFYDFKQAEVKVIIRDTQWTADYNTEHKPYVDETSPYSVMNGNSTVPLLDPNNPYNNQYSLAIMNVSDGFDKVLDEIKTVLTGFNSENAKTAIPRLIYEQDKGFPAESKIAAGSLEYYNRFAEQDYDNRYRYLASDFDGDVLDILNQSDSLGYIQNDYFTARLDTKRVTVNFADYTTETLTSEQLTELLNLFTKTDANGKVLRFDNKYGLTMEIEKEENAAEEDVPVGITFVYKVITITATASMDKNFVSYYYDSDAKAYEVSAPYLPKTATQVTNESYMLRPLITDGTRAERLSNGMTSDINRNKYRAIEVFTQGSLIFENKTGSGELATVAPHSIYGAPQQYIIAENNANNGNSQLPQKTNTYNYGEITLKMDQIGNGDRNNQNCYTVDLSRLFRYSSKLGLQNIRISYNGDTSDDAQQKLKDSFLSGKNGNALELINVSATAFTIRARRELAQNDVYEFRLEVRRVLPGENETTFAYAATDESNSEQTVYLESEVVYINFRIKVTFDNAYFKNKQNPTFPWSNQTINKNESLKLSDRLDINSDILKLDENCVSVTAYSTDPNVVSVAYNRQEQQLDFTVHSSGTVRIKYVVRLYDYELTDSFELNVTMLSSMPETVKVVDEKKVYFSNLKSYLRRVNKLGNITLDLKEDAETKLPYRFEITETENAINKTDAECEWKPLESIPFLNQVYIDPSEAQAFIGLVMGKFEPTEETPDPPVVRVVVNFTSGSSDYGVAFRVTPAAQTLRDKESVGKTKLELVINKGAGTIVIANHGTDTNAIEERREFEKLGDSYSISVNYFISLMSGAHPGSNVYEIVAVNATDGINNYSKYIDVTTNRSEGATAIIITPLYPTEEGSPCNIQLSVRYTGDSKDVTLLNFSLVVTGIKTVLEQEEYVKIILATFFSVLLVLVIIFFIRMGVYWKKKADQRRIIKKNQTLIKMRDKMHNKTEAVSKEQLVRTKLKMEDPKYAKMFNEMRQNKEAETGITLDNSLVAQKADKKGKAAKAAKKKKGGKKSLEELQAELAAKREAVARMQSGDFSDMPEGMAPADGMPPMENTEMEQPVINDVPAFDSEVQFDGMSAEQLDEQLSETLGADSIVFEPLDDNNNDNGNQG